MKEVLETNGMSQSELALRLGMTEKTVSQIIKFAQDLLIPPSVAGGLAYLRGKAQICQFAESLGIAPGIVVGRLQRERLLPPSHCNDLKRKLEWAKENDFRSHC